MGRGFPLRLQSDPSCGLQWSSDRHLCPGALVCRAEPYAAVVCQRYGSVVCSQCFRATSRKMTWCPGCRQVAWCSPECRSKSESRRQHTDIECRCLRRVQSVRDLDDVEISECRLILRILCRWYDERHGGGGSVVPGFSFEDAMTLVSNDQEYAKMRPEMSLRMDRKREVTEGLLIKGWRRELMDEGGLDSAGLRGLFCREHCNTYGLWGQGSQLRGIAMYPVASFFNHSCSPNLVHHCTLPGAVLEVRTLCPVSPGETVAISYVELVDDTPQRRARLMVNFCFDCSCPRCSTSATQEQRDDEWRRLSKFTCRKRECVGTLGLIREASPPFFACNLCGCHEPAGLEDWLCDCEQRGK